MREIELVGLLSRKGVAKFWTVALICVSILLLVVATLAVAQHLSASRHWGPVRRVAAWRAARADEKPPFPRIADRRAQRTADFYWETNDHGEWRWIQTGRRRPMLRYENGQQWEAEWRAIRDDDPLRNGSLIVPSSWAEIWQWETNSDFEYRRVRYQRCSED